MRSPICSGSPTSGAAALDAGLQVRAAAKLAQIDAEFAELTAVRDTLRAALVAGCDDLLACSESPFAKCPSATTATATQPREGSDCGC
ncbi:hypothetical protein [Nocardia asiatica]|uniref:hypothetical protein n=1 Tax=Nocardia asiatica TaxID=209252 RepID=UPI003EE35914